ncbi:MAG TPA: R3H domain-containing nucleic acid-binding protein [Thermoanaerobaculia bacterium]|nr:R3H domain-containing nucleic acid-binding protein [Thermoanaerobaculia bacterium]
MSQRFEGRNLEEALTQASETLGVDRWQLTYHVLLEKRGFLGGVKRVVIEADVNRAAAPPAPAPAAAPIADVAEQVEDRRPRQSGQAGLPVPHDRPSRGRGGRGGRGGGPREERGGGGGRDRGGRGRGGRDRDLRSGDFEKFFADVPEQGPESEQAKVARDWVEEVVSFANLDLVARSEENETQIHVKLFGADGKRLIDRHGELLDAIQVLANKALVGRKVEKEIELDCDSFKDKRNEDLAQRAKEVADRVRKGGREELLPAMTPIERRIVHIALRDDADVTTESRGDGFYKRVAILLRSQAQPPAESTEPSSEPQQEP